MIYLILKASFKYDLEHKVNAEEKVYSVCGFII